MFQLKVDPSSHRVDDGLRLLEDLLLHERGEVALHDLLDLHLKGGDLPGQVALLVVPVDGQDPQLHGCHIVVLQEDHLFKQLITFVEIIRSQQAHPVGVLDDGRGIACKEVLHCVPVRGVDLLRLKCKEYQSIRRVL